MRHLYLLPALILTVSGSAQDPAPAAQAPALATRLQRVERLSTGDLRQLQGELALAELAPEAKAYHEAHLAYQLGIRHASGNAKTDEALLDRAIKLLESRKDADSKALLGACLSGKIRFAPSAGISLAPRASGLFEEALKTSPGNPRALIFQGVHVLHTPAFFGGGAASALPILEKAVKAAAAEPVPTELLAPAWGRAESLVWLAQAQRQSGQEELAQASLRGALKVDPQFGWAQMLLEKGGK